MLTARTHDRKSAEWRSIEQCPHAQVCIHPTFGVGNQFQKVGVKLQKAKLRIFIDETQWSVSKRLMDFKTHLHETPGAVGRVIR